jgi:hypothetical protein
VNFTFRYEFFRRNQLAYHCQDEGSSLVARGPVFEHGEGDQMDRFRYNDYDRLTLSHLAGAEVALFYEHHRRLASVVGDPGMVRALCISLSRARSQLSDCFVCEFATFPSTNASRVNLVNLRSSTCPWRRVPWRSFTTTA